MKKLLYLIAVITVASLSVIGLILLIGSAIMVGSISYTFFQHGDLYRGLMTAILSGGTFILFVSFLRRIGNEFF